AKMPIMAITTNNSTKVNPFSIRRISYDNYFDNHQRIRSRRATLARALARQFKNSARGGSIPQPGVGPPTDLPPGKRPPKNIPFAFRLPGRYQGRALSPLSAVPPAFQAARGAEPHGLFTFLQIPQIRARSRPRVTML